MNFNHVYWLDSDPFVTCPLFAAGPFNQLAENEAVVSHTNSPSGGNGGAAEEVFIFNPNPNPNRNPNLLTMILCQESEVPGTQLDVMSPGAIDPDTVHPDSNLESGGPSVHRATAPGLFLGMV